MHSIWSSARPQMSARQRRLERQRTLRSLPGLGRVLSKAHKPKLLGGHPAVRWSWLERVNGYDERFVGYGFDDDDLARRLYAAGAVPAVCVDTIPAFHFWHATRAPARPTAAHGHATFAQPWSVRAQTGLDRGADQPEPDITTVTAAAPGAPTA
jgi:GT2 family glycosyltransferase